MEVWLASGNSGKLKEYKTLLQHLELDLHHQGELPTYYSPDETGSTFLENARIKAKSLAALKKEAWVFAEDSGLEVVGLGGMPGIHSARYAGDNASDPENRAKLLKMLKIRSAGNRNARFVATIVLLSPIKEDGQRDEYSFEGEMAGEISKIETGTSGFGYDPVFVPEGQTQTLAELGLAYKNQNSHRFHATKKLAEKLASLI